MKTYKCFTDYPLYPIEYNKLAPVREVKLISYDGDKYCKIRYNGEVFEVKAGYLYSKKRRWSSVKMNKNLRKALRRLER